MDVSMNPSSATAQYVSDMADMLILKKAINIEAQGAMALIDAIPQQPQQNAANSPQHLGQNIDILA